MIKRNYFIAGEIHLPNGSKTLFFRQFYVKSFLPDAGKTINQRQQSIAKDNNCKVTDMVITAFNRC